MTRPSSPRPCPPPDPAPAARADPLASSPSPTARLRRALGIGVLAAFAAAGALVVTGCRPELEPLRPNVLLISIETLRADHVGSNGYARNTTPNLDRLSRQGARFETVVAQAPFTLPSVASLMTARTPPGHGVRNHPGTLQASVETLAEQFQKAGYRTAAMTRHTWLRNRSGLDRGFDEYHNNTFQAGLDARSLSLAAVDWMEKRPSGQPFFLWLHFLDPHLPYTPSYPYSVLFGGPDGAHEDEPQVKHLRGMSGVERDDYRPTPYADLAGGPYYDLVLPQYPNNEILLDLAFWRRSRGSIFFGGARYAKRDVEEMIDLYDGAILYTDDNLGRVLRSLSALGLSETTVVAVTSDHGEALGEHDLHFTHDFSLYDEVLRVPLAIRYPGVVSEDTVIDQQVRLIDLGPTLLDLVGLPPLRDVEGRSLKPLLEGGSLPYREAFAENAPARPQFPEYDRVFFPGNRGKWRMVRNERWKLIRIPHPDGDRHELYDLEHDPRELENLFSRYPGEAQKLMPALDAWMASDAASGTETIDPEEELDPATLEQLRTLGYVQ